MYNRWIPLIAIMLNKIVSHILEIISYVTHNSRDTIPLLWHQCMLHPPKCWLRCVRVSPHDSIPMNKISEEQTTQTNWLRCVGPPVKSMHENVCSLHVSFFTLDKPALSSLFFYTSQHASFFTNEFFTGRFFSLLPVLYSLVGFLHLSFFTQVRFFSSLGFFTCESSTLDKPALPGLFLFIFYYTF